MSKNNILDQTYAKKLQHLCDLMNATDIAYYWYNDGYYIIHQVGHTKTIYGYSDAIGLGMNCIEIAICIKKTVTWQEMEKTDKELARLFCLNYQNEDIPAIHQKTYGEYLKTEHWQKIREAAILRAGERCMLCNAGNVTLNVHHRTYERLGNEEPMDVIVLCETHHAQFHRKDKSA